MTSMKRECAFLIFVFIMLFGCSVSWLNSLLLLENDNTPFNLLSVKLKKYVNKDNNLFDCLLFSFRISLLFLFDNGSVLELCLLIILVILLLLLMLSSGLQLWELILLLYCVFHLLKLFPNNRTKYKLQKHHCYYYYNH